MANCCTVRLFSGLLFEVTRLTILSLQVFPDAQQRYFLNFSFCYFVSILSPRTIGTKATLSPRELLLLPTYGQSTILSLVLQFIQRVHISGR